MPTIAEAGFPEAAYVSWYGIYVPAATPDAIVEKINDGINKALQNPDVQRQLAIANIPGKPMPLGELAALMKADYEKLTKVVDDLGHGAAVDVLSPRHSGAMREHRTPESRGFPGCNCTP